MENQNSFSEFRSIEDESENNVELTERKNNIIKIIDEQVQISEKSLNLPSIIPKKEDIQKLANKLDISINNIEHLISQLLDKQKDEYIIAFSQFIDSIKKNLSIQLEEMEKAFEAKKKTNDIRVISCERDFFKGEAIRLSALCKKMKTEIEEISFNHKIMNMELANLKVKYKELLLQTRNKKEFNKPINLNNISNLLNGNKLPVKTDSSKICCITDNNNNFNSNSKNNTSSISKNNINESNTKCATLENEKKTLPKNSKSQDIIFLNHLLKRSKYETKKEKDKANKAIAELSNVYLQKNKLEIIFENCVEETKKIIFNRKVNENKFFKLKNKAGLLKYDNRVNFSTKFEEFLPSDKQRTLENFIFDDDVYNTVKDIIFKRPKLKVKNNLNLYNNISNILHLSETESKLKVRKPDIPKVKIKNKTNSVLPEMKNNNKMIITDTNININPINNNNNNINNSPSFKNMQPYRKYRTITIHKS